MPAPLAYFPSQLPDELLSSRLVRMLWHQRWPSSIQAWVLTPGPRFFFRVPWTIDLNNFNHLVPDSWALDESTIHSHCILPFFSPFLTAKAREKYFVWVFDRSVVRNQFHTPLTKWHVQVTAPKFFRACPACVRDDTAEFGEPYFHRLHHLPGVRMCLKHRAKLTELRFHPHPAPENKKSFYALADFPVDPLPEHDFIPALKDSIDLLLQRPFLHDEALDFRLLYLLKLDLLSKRRRCASARYQTEVMTPIKERYQDLAGELSINLWCNTWLRGYLNGNPLLPLPPIGHLVLQHFLGISLSEALPLAKRSLWQCANPFCDAGDVQVVRPNYGNKGYRITCPKCQFDASAKQEAPLRSKPGIITIYNRGTVFNEGLLKMFNAGEPVTKIGPKVGLTYREVRNLLRELGAKVEEIDRRNSKATLRETRRAVCRNTLTKFMQDHPGLEREEILNGLRNEYVWLRRHDRDWLETALPPRRHFNAAKGKVMYLKSQKEGVRAHSPNRE